MTKNQHGQENLTILVLGTGGTIAGLGGEAYLAAQLPIESLLPPSQHHILTEQVAQVDSKDMSFEVWERLYVRVKAALEDPRVDAIVITHGTDTMEETAYFLHRTLEAGKPVILTGAMHPADSAVSDGSQNLAEALNFAEKRQAGVWVAFAGHFLSGGQVQKVHPTQHDAFREFEIPLPHINTNSELLLPIHHWPRVDIVVNYVGADGAAVRGLMAQKVDGIVVAGTGNGTVSEAMGLALNDAIQAGITVRLVSRCTAGFARANATHSFKVSNLPAPQARIELLLALLDLKDHRFAAPPYNTA